MIHYHECLRDGTSVIHFVVRTKDGKLVTGATFGTVKVWLPDAGSSTGDSGFTIAEHGDGWYSATVEAPIGTHAYARVSVPVSTTNAEDLAFFLRFA